MAVLAGVLAVVVLAQGDALTPIEISARGAPFRTALVQLGILYPAFLTPASGGPRKGS